MTVSHWLASLGVPDADSRKEGAFKLDHAACVGLALCSRLQSIRALDLRDAGICNLVRYVGKGEAENDLRQSLVGVCVVKGQAGAQHKVALTASDEIVMKRHPIARNEGKVAWEGGGVIQHWASDGVLAYISLGPLYAEVDTLFAGQEVATATTPSTKKTLGGEDAS